MFIVYGAGKGKVWITITVFTPQREHPVIRSLSVSYLVTPGLTIYILGLVIGAGLRRVLLMLKH